MKRWLFPNQWFNLSNVRVIIRNEPKNMCNYIFNKLNLIILFSLFYNLLDKLYVQIRYLTQMKVWPLEQRWIYLNIYFKISRKFSEAPPELNWGPYGTWEGAFSITIIFIEWRFLFVETRSNGGSSYPPEWPVNEKYSYESMLGINELL